MTDPAIVVTDDEDHVGHARLTFAAARATAPRIALRFIDGTFLGPDGRRGRERRHFPTEVVGEGASREFRIGPEVTAHVREAEIVAFSDEDGAALGTTAWEGIRVAPILGTGARLGPSGARARTPFQAAAPSPARRPDALVQSAKPLPVAEEGAALAEAPAARPPRKRVRPASVAAAVASTVLTILSGLIVCVLAGLAGWRLEPTRIAFEGPQGGPFLPITRRVEMRIAWYARPLLVRPPVPPAAGPDWLGVKQVRSDAGWSIDASLNRSAELLAPGRHEGVLPVAFPFRVVDVLSFVVVVDTPKPKVRDERAPSAPVTSSFDNAVCDRLAGNRFDGDHPAGAGFTDEIFVLSQHELDAGLEACDPNPTRTGADRRLTVQRGRLLAQRALLRLAAGDAAGAGSDMDQAVALWRHGDDVGSAYAANLLGAYHAGTFNRGGHAFVDPDDSIADGFWKKAMEGGNVVAQRNYAAQLLVGRGVPADPPRAAALLRDAAGKGDLHAAGVLGVALFTGNAPGVAADKATGLRLVVAAQCVDRMAAGLLDRAIASGAEPASSRHPCP